MARGRELGGLKGSDVARTRHRIVAGVLVRRRAVLLCHRRADRPWYPDCWDLPGGHVEPGEAALDRECREELGITVLAARATEITVEDPSFSLTVVTVERWTGEPVNRAVDEHDAVAWFTATEIAGLPLADPRLLPLLTSVVTDDDGERRGP